MVRVVSRVLGTLRCNFRTSASSMVSRRISTSIPRTFRRNFSAESYERAPVFPLADNAHLRPNSVPGLPKRYEDCNYVWVSGMDSAILRPPSWYAAESTLDYPWNDLMGNPLRVAYVTKENLQEKGYITTGLTVSAYCLDRQAGNMGDLVKENKVQQAVDTFLAPIRFSDGSEINESQPMPTLNPDIKVDAIIHHAYTSPHTPMNPKHTQRNHMDAP